MKTYFIISILVITVLGAVLLTEAQEVRTPQREQYLIDQSSVALLKEKAETLYQEGKLLEARTVYETILAKNPLDAFGRAEIQKEVERLNAKIIFSRIPTEDSVEYIVKPGDSLYKIAKEHGTTVELIMKSNGLSSETIYPNDKLKIITAKFSVYIDKSDNILEVKLGERVVRTYPCATGENNNTPVGTFTIRDKLVNPTWYHAGAVVPPDSPENILGTRWLGFDLRGYGIHGTTLPETIGSQSTAGCIRLFNKDVEELYALIPYGTKVVIVD